MKYPLPFWVPKPWTFVTMVRIPFRNPLMSGVSGLLLVSDYDFIQSL